MHGVDLLVLLAYIVAVLFMGARLGAGTKGLKGYFLGDSNVPAWAVMISIVATETSTATFLSVPAIACAPGGNFTYLQLALGYIVGRLVVATILLPSYFRGEILTAYEVLNRRFGAATKSTASILFLLTRTLGDGLRLFLAAKVVQELMLLMGLFGEESGLGLRVEWSMPIAIILMGASTLVYTYIGGMKAVVWTDVLQFFVYMIGAFVALRILISHLPGGWTQLVESGQAANKFQFFDFSFDFTRTFTFWAGVVGGMVLNTATHGADQLMVQRYLSARSQAQAAGALVTSGFVVFAQFALFLLIGVGLFALYQVDPPERILKPDSEFAYFIVRYMPAGLLGLVIAAIFSAAMSTLSSSLNSSSATTIDLIRNQMPHASESTMLRLSRGLTLVWGVAQMSVALYASRFLSDNVVNNALAIASFTTGIVLGLFLLGIWSRNVVQSSALAGLLTGLAAVSYAKFGAAWAGKNLWRGNLFGADIRIPAYPLDGPLAWPWYALVGSTTVVLIGLLTSRLIPRQGPAPESTP